MDSTAYAYPSSSEKVIEFPRHAASEDRAAYDAQARHRTVIADDLLETIGAELGDTCGWLYVLLERHANKQGWCDPTEERLATLSRRSVRWVREQLKRLEAAGFIRIERGRKTKYNTPDSNAYTLPYHLNGLPDVGQTVPEGVAEGSAEGMAEGSTPNRSAKVVKASSQRSSQQGEGTRAQRAVPIPTDFILTDERLAYAAGRGLHPSDARIEFEKLRNWAESKGERKVSWDATWKNWVIRAQEDRKKRGGSQQPPNVHTRGHVG